MPSKPNSRIKAIVLSFLVVFIWATSWVFIKIGLKEMPALTFAGLRYFLAFLCMLPFLFKKSVRDEIRALNRADWLLIILLGLFSYFIAQGSQFISLDFLSATTLSLMLNMSSVIVAFSAILLIKEVPTFIQWTGLVINLAGVSLYFLPMNLGEGKTVGFVFGILCLLANSMSTLLGRKINRGGRLHPVPVTLLSMGIGSTILLGTGLGLQGLPLLSTQSVLIIILLAVVNTAFAFTVWNYTLQTLSAIESSIINGTMMVQVAILAWIFLGEEQSVLGVIALTLAFLGAIVVNLKTGKNRIVK